MRHYKSECSALGDLQNERWRHDGDQRRRENVRESRREDRRQRPCVVPIQCVLVQGRVDAERTDRSSTSVRNLQLLNTGRKLTLKFHIHAPIVQSFPEPKSLLIPKQIMFGIVDGTNKRGWPCREWMDDTVSWCKTGLQELNSLVQDRRRRKLITRQAMDTNGRWSHGPWRRRRRRRRRRQVRWHDAPRSQWQEYALKGCHLDIRAQIKKADVSRCVCRWRVLCPNISKLDHEL